MTTFVVIDIVYTIDVISHAIYHTCSVISQLHITGGISHMWYGAFCVWYTMVYHKIGIYHLWYTRPWLVYTRHGWYITWPNNRSKLHLTYYIPCYIAKNCDIPWYITEKSWYIPPPNNRSEPLINGISHGIYHSIYMSYNLEYLNFSCQAEWEDLVLCLQSNLLSHLNHLSQVHAALIGMTMAGRTITTIHCK